MNNKKIDIELELANIPSIREVMYSLRELSEKCSKDGEIIKLEFSHRNFSPKPFGNPGNAGIDVFLKKYWPLIQEYHFNLNKIVELYSELSSLEKLSGKTRP